MSFGKFPFDQGLKKSQIDFSYLEKCGSRKNYNLPTCFDVDQKKFEPGHMLEARVTQIYDPSKFWMVTKFKELEIFQKYLFKFYYMNHTYYRIPENKLEVDLYCIAFVDNNYYRGVIIGFTNTYQKEQEVQIYFIDYGMSGIVNTKNIYYICEKCATVPQFALRASLAGICPNQKENWTSTDVIHFNNLVVDKILEAVIIKADVIRKVLHVQLSEKNEKDKPPVHEALISEGCAAYYPDLSTNNSNEKKLNFSYIFPTHEALEKGVVPFTVSDAEFQTQLVPLMGNLSYYYRKKSMEDGDSD